MFGIKDGYISRPLPTYSTDPADSMFQPDVYTMAALLAELSKATCIIDIGCGSAWKLVPLAEQFSIVGLDIGPNLEIAGFGSWRDVDLETITASFFDDTLIPLHDAVIICADVVEHLINPTTLLNSLVQWLKTAKVAVLSTPARDAYYPDSHVGPPENAAHVREWSRLELVSYLESFGFVIPYAGLTRAHPTQGCQTTIAVLKGR